MPRGAQAILNHSTGHLDGGAIARVLRSLRTPDSITAALGRLKQAMASNPKSARLWGLTILAVIVVGFGGVMVWRMSASAGNSSADDVPIQPRRNTQKPVRVTVNTTAQETGPIGSSFPTDYKVLVARSIFAIGGTPSSSRSSSQNASSNSAPPAVQNVPSAANLLLKGILGEDARLTAFVEDVTAKKIMEVHVGDALGPGRVRELTPFQLTYEFNGKTMPISVGQGLDGSAAVMADTPPVQVATKSGHKKRHSSGE